MYPPDDGAENYILLQERAAGAGKGTKWKDIRQLDRFFVRVYDYFAGAGFTCILLSHLRDLLILAFIVFFSFFLLVCVEWDRLATDSNSDDTSHRLHLADYIVFSASVHPVLAFCLAIFCLYWVWHLYFILREIPQLLEMRSFFSTELEIEESELATLQWKEVIRKLLAAQERGQISLHGGRPATALDIANRIMRRENYVIALFNKDKIPLSISVPCMPSLGGTLLTAGLEWNVLKCLNDFIDRHHLTMTRHRETEALAAELRKRFLFMGILNLVLMPFIFVFLCLYSFFKYAAEVHKSPGELGARQWTRYARWRLREFNELPHVFNARMNKTIEPANKYVDQFPPGAVGILASLVNFLAGSVVAVVLIVAFVDENMSRRVDIFPDHSVVWFGAVATTVFAVTRGIIPKQNAVFDPEAAMLATAKHTHYLPKDWRGHAHRTAVFSEFTALFRFRFVAFLLEIVSIFITPFILLFSMTAASEDIVVFLRDFTRPVEGVGAVCAFALFDFARHGNPAVMQASTKSAQSEGGTPAHPEAWYSADFKMEHSFINFKNNHPEVAAGAHSENLLASLPAEGEMDSEQMSLSLTLGEPLPHSALAPAPMSPGASAISTRSGDVVLPDGRIAHTKQLHFREEDIGAVEMDRIVHARQEMDKGKTAERKAEKGYSPPPTPPGATPRPRPATIRRPGDDDGTPPGDEACTFDDLASVMDKYDVYGEPREKQHH